MKHLFCTWPLLLLSLSSFAQSPSDTKGTNRVDLDDIKIKGEANKNAVSFSSRSKHDLNDRIKLRRDFNREILENLPEEMMSEK